MTTEFIRHMRATLDLGARDDSDRPEEHRALTQGQVFLLPSVPSRHLDGGVLALARK
jgi:hypothetical protein